MIITWSWVFTDIDGDLMNLSRISEPFIVLELINFFAIFTPVVINFPLFTDFLSLNLWCFYLGDLREGSRSNRWGEEKLGADKDTLKQT